MLGIRFFCWVSLRLSRSPSWNGCTVSGVLRAGCRAVVFFLRWSLLWFDFFFCRFSPVVALFLLGYLLAALVTASVAIQYTIAIAAFLTGVGFAVLYDRRLKAQGGIAFTIVKLF